MVEQPRLPGTETHTVTWSYEPPNTYRAVCTCGWTTAWFSLSAGRLFADAWRDMVKHGRTA